MSEPRTEAGRRLAHDLIGTIGLNAAILAIEVEARADALREAAERVRGLIGVRHEDAISYGVDVREVLAILDDGSGS